MPACSTRAVETSLLALAFSAAMFAMHRSAELVRTFGWTQRFAAGSRVPATRGFRGRLLLTGALVLAFGLLWLKLRS